MPRACLKCGHENPDDVDFCEQCGEYVRWELSGVRHAVPAPPAAAEPPAAAAPVAAPPHPSQHPQPSQPPPVEQAAVAPPELTPPPVGDGGARVPGPATPEPPPEPDAVVLTLRHPEDESATGADVTGRVEAGGSTTLIALVRNQSGIVDNYDLHVEGLPAEWWTIAPSTVYLVPYGAPGGEYEQEVTVSFHPPRAAEAEARTWTIRIVAVSKANGTVAGRVAAGLDITPYHELEAEMRPAQASGRRKAAYALAVRNRANAPVDVQLAGVDPDNAMRFAFQKPRFTVAPGRRNGSAFMVKPPKPALVGRPVHRRFEIASTVIGSETGALPTSATLVQKPWIPIWALMILPLLLIAGIAAYLLWPRTATVPDLEGQQVFAAQQLVDEAGLTLGNQTETPTDKVPSGTIVEQSPPAGEKVDKSSDVSIEVAVATGFGKVPNVVGKTLAEAERILSQQKFIFAAAAQPQDPEKDQITTQIPEANAVADKAKPVQIFFAAAGSKTTPTATGGGTPTEKKPDVKTNGANVALASVAGLGPAAAIAALKKQKVDATLAQEFSPDVKAGALVRQDPPEGSKVGEGSTIVLTYSKGYPEVIFDHNGNVFMANAVNGKNAKPVAKGPDVEGEAAINPTGTLIAFQRGPEIAGQIWTVKPNDPLSAKQLTEAGFDDGRPTFSPDGKVIAFARGKAGDSRADRDLCFVPAGGGKVACKPDPNHTLSRPTWSHDGRVILAQAIAPNEQQAELLEYTSAKPSSPRPDDWSDHGYVTDGLHDQNRREGVIHAAFSPDGTQLALTTNWGRDFVSLLVAPFKDGVVGKPKPFPDVRACEVAWRADGKELMFTQHGSSCAPTEVSQLFRVDLKKPSDQTALGSGGSPAWSPVVLGKK